MARSRNIKPGFFTNDKLADLPALTRLLFIGLWTIADRDGRLEDRPKKVKAETMPYDDFNCDNALSDLEKEGFIVRYKSGELGIIQVVNWCKHQNPHIKEQASSMPPQEMHQTSMVHKQDKQQPSPEVAGLIPDPGFLIPDSSPLIPDCSTTVESAQDAPTPPSEKSSKSKQVAKPEDVDQQVWDDWLALRKAKKAPVTETVVKNARIESGKAGMGLQAFFEVWCARGSQGLQASWLEGSGKASGPSLTFAQRDQLDKRQAWEKMTGRAWPENDGGAVGDVFEMEKFRSIGGPP